MEIKTKKTQKVVDDNKKSPKGKKRLRNGGERKQKPVTSDNTNIPVKSSDEGRIGGSSSKKRKRSNTRKTRSDPNVIVKKDIQIGEIALLGHAAEVNKAKNIPVKSSNEYRIGGSSSNKRKRCDTRLTRSETNVVAKKDIQIGEFTLLGRATEVNKAKISRVLPHWLNHPVIIKRNLSDAQGLDNYCFLDGKIISKLKSSGISSFFPVQKTLIPEIIKGAQMDFRFRPRDICVASPTGSGKTLAYVLPIIQCLTSKNVRAIRAVVVVPVVELAQQVYHIFFQYCRPFNLNVVALFGASTISEQSNLVEKRQGRYCSKVDIIVCTPGALSAHIANTAGLDFSLLRFLVFDEADQLFEGDFSALVVRIQRQIMGGRAKALNMAVSPCFQFTNLQSELQGNKRISSGRNNTDDSDCIPRLFSMNSKDKEEKCDEYSEPLPQVPTVPLQRLLFSATLSTKPQELQNISLYRPILYLAEQGTHINQQQPSGVTETSVSNQTVGKSIRPDELIEQFVKTTVELKPLMLHYLIHKERKSSSELRILIFTSSIHLTLKVAILLKAMSRDNYIVKGFTSKQGSKRKALMKDFRNGKTNVLVSSDAMARGMDLPDVDLVVSYDVPSEKIYTHRVGRTARAGKEGRAISIVSEEELSDLKKVCQPSFDRVKEMEIPVSKLEKFEERFNGALACLAKESKKIKKR